MVSNPLVSIIVPVYNVEPYIEQCCRSVFEQTYSNCEFIFVDDCGTDRSMEILYGLTEEYSHLKTRVRIIRHEGNKGLAVARKTGIESARGVYVQFVDSDDYIEPDMTEELVAIAREHDADIVVCDFDSIHRVRPKDIDMSVTELDGKQCMCWGMCGNLRFVTVWTKLFRRSLLYDNKLYAPPRTRYDEDGCMVFRAFYLAKKVLSTQKVLYHYRIVDESMTNTIRRYLSKDPYLLLDVISLYESFIKEYGIIDEKILYAYNMHKLKLFKHLVLYSDTEVLYNNKFLFDSLTVKFIFRILKSRWPHALLFFVWKSHQVWLLRVLRYIRDKHCY